MECLTLHAFIVYILKNLHAILISSADFLWIIIHFQPTQVPSVQQTIHSFPGLSGYINLPR